MFQSPIFNIANISFDDILWEFLNLLYLKLCITYIISSISTFWASQNIFLLLPDKLLKNPIQYHDGLYCLTAQSVLILQLIIQFGILGGHQSIFYFMNLYNNNCVLGKNVLCWTWTERHCFPWRFVFIRICLTIIECLKCVQPDVKWDMGCLYSLQHMFCMSF